MKFPNVIALVGNAGSGKSTIADYLIDLHGYERVKFAGPLKDMLRVIGLTDDELEGDLKEKPCATLCGQTPRHAMVTLGTEWARDHISPDLWVTIWQNKVRDVIDAAGRVVVDDCRFANEYRAVKAMGGVAWHIVRPDHAGSSIPTHRSEGALAPYYDQMTTIVNDLGVFELHLAAFDALKAELNRAAMTEHTARENDARLIATSNEVGR